MLCTVTRGSLGEFENGPEEIYLIIENLVLWASELFWSSGALEYWSIGQRREQRLTHIQNVKCQSPNAKSNPNVK